MEVSLFARPNAGWDVSAMARSPAGAVVAPAAHGQEQVVACLDDARRAAAHGFRSVLIADIGVLAAFAEARRTGSLPADMQAKISVMLPAANAAAARVLADLGADTINLPTDLSLAQIAAIRAAVDVPLDVYVEAPDNLGGFVRLHEIPELIRVAAPVYVKFGLSNAPDVYPAGTHLESTTVALSRERVRRARLGMELLARSGYEPVDLRARRRGARRAAAVIVRLLLWNLDDSKTSLDELRARLPAAPNRTWISNESTERFGVVETWDRAPGEFPQEILGLIGKAPDVAEEFDVEA